MKNISVSTAESCTGGLLAYNFVKNADSSKVFKGGYITYSNEMKIKELKVKKVSLKKNGAVSYQVAEEMVEGLYKRNKTKICISTTGIAGPGGSTQSKPVGLIYIAIRINKKKIIIKKNFKGTRIQIQKKCVNFILKYLDKLI
ncbi:nicotinamide-nucleotide amidohydrolase family protein [Alphaproteobacteria bacterium]|nr:nicotinamide-nucleotide amidohydrolase family protein [Alphaproteobacteria bacterium]